MFSPPASAKSFICLGGCKSHITIAGDDERPKCRRCQVKQLPCTRPVKRTVFKHGSVGSFSKDQKWVNSEAKRCMYRPLRCTHLTACGADPVYLWSLVRFHNRGGNAGREPTSPNETSPTPVMASDPDDAPVDSHPIDGDHQSPPTSSSKLSPLNIDLDGRSFTSSNIFANARKSGQHQSRASSSSQSSFLPPISQISPHSCTPQHESQAAAMSTHGLTQQPQTPSHNRSHAPLEHVQEACLFRYYIEEISHWVCYICCVSVVPHSNYQLED